MIIPVHAANPGAMTGHGNWTYVLAGELPTLIDAGIGAGEHLDAIAAHLPEGPKQVLVTHHHSDHSSGARAIVARWPAARCLKYPSPAHDAKVAVAWQPLADGDVVRAGNEDLQVVHTPGHAADHICFWHAESHTMFSGDMVVRGSTVVIPAADDGSLADYLASLRRILRFQPVRMLPAHGPAIDDPETIIQQYLEHRQQRERQIVSALETGRQTIESITADIYPALLPALVPMAHQSVLAHLEKLRNEGRAVRRGDDWMLTEPL